MEKKITVLKKGFEKIEINADRGNKLFIVFEDENGKTKKLDISKSAKISFSGGDVVFDIKNDKTMFSSLVPYNKGTVALEGNSLIKAEVNKLIEKDPSKDVFVFKYGGGIIVGYATDKIEYYSKSLEEAKKQDTKEYTKSESINDLKAYETKPNGFKLMFGLIGNAVLPQLAVETAKTINNDLIKTFQDRGVSVSVRERKLIIENLLKESFSLKARMAINELRGKDKKFDAVEKIVKEFYQDTLDMFKEASFDLLPLSKIDETIKKEYIQNPIQFSDWQSGTEQNLLYTAKEAGLDVQLIGTELRKIPEDERLPNNKVLDGVNFSIHKGDINAVGITANKNMENTINYSNPPYDMSNQIAKDSIEVMPDKQMIFGLYPTSQEEMLKENINGHIFRISRELAGYGGVPNTPETFLFVVGERFDEEVKHSQGLLGQLKARCFVENIKTDDPKEALSQMIKKLNLEKDSFNLTHRLSKTIAFFSDPQNGLNRLERIPNELKKNIEKTREFFQNQEMLKNAIEETKEALLERIAGNDVLYKEKVFPDVRYFEKDGFVQRLKFDDVIKNNALLNAYASGYPDILKVVKALAEKKGINIGVDIAPVALYDLTNPKKPEIKDKVTNMNLGLMVNKYHPSAFDISREDNKNALLLIIEKLYEKSKQNFSDFSEEFIKIVEKSDKLVLKMEGTFKEDKVFNEEYFVFVDKDGNDLAKLNFSVSDVINTLKETGYFNLEDYVELAEIDNDKKSKIMQNYEKMIENVLDITLQRTDYNFNEAKEAIKESKKEMFLVDSFYKIIQNSYLSSEDIKHITKKAFEMISLHEEKTNKRIPDIQKLSVIKTILEKAVKDKDEQLDKISENEKIAYLAELKDDDDRYEFWNEQRIAVSVRLMKKFKLNDTLSEKVNFDMRLERGFINNFAKNKVFAKDGISKKVVSEVAKQIFQEYDKEFLKFYETDRKEYEKKIFDAIENAGIVLDDEEKEQIIIDTYDFLSDDFTKRKATFSGAYKVARTLVDMYSTLIIKKERGDKIDYAKEYDNYFEKTFLYVNKLMEHQFKNPERFVAMSDQNKLYQMFWEMRAGKTNAFLFATMMLGLLNEKDSLVVLDTKNINDILSQLVEFNPLQYMHTTVHSVADNKSFLKESAIENFLPKGEYVPNIPVLFSKYFKGRGTMQLETALTFSYDFEKILSLVDEKGYTKDDILKLIPDSEFLPLLEISCLKG